MKFALALIAGTSFATKLCVEYDCNDDDSSLDEMLFDPFYKFDAEDVQ